MLSKTVQRGFEEAATFSEADQEWLGTWMLELIADEKQWNRLFADPRSDAVLDRLIDEAKQEFQAGLTEELDPDKL